MPLMDAGGQVTHLVFSLNDVTENRRQQLALENRETLLQTVLESLPVGVWIHDEKGRIIHGNRKGREIWGGTQLIGMDRFNEFNGWRLKTGKKIKAGEWSVMRAITRGETILNEEIRIVGFDGVSKIILNSSIPIRDAGEKSSAPSPSIRILPVTKRRRKRYWKAMIICAPCRRSWCSRKNGNEKESPCSSMTASPRCLPPPK